MKLDKLMGERFKERPADCVIDSHALMLRGGYFKGVASGIYSLYTPLRRVTRKIEEIIRQEMDSIGGQEVLFPVVLPGALWQESGRFDSVGSELVRFKDRNDSPLVLGMTHEEAAVHLVRESAKSYTKYPFMIYQIQTKFRDEARPRGGLIRVREFTMKDAYSFHTSQADLEEYYQQCRAAYHRIFARCGIPQVVEVASDSGMMGGNLSHEFMLLTPIGEDTLALCPHCGYRANMEAAECIYPQTTIQQESPALTPVHTPGIHTIEELCGFLNIPVRQTCKTVVYQKDSDNGLVVVFLRGDREVNEIKLTNRVKDTLHPANLTPESGLIAGFIGPVGLSGNFTVFVDRSLEGEKNLVCGANREDTHCTGLDIARDVKGTGFVDLAKIQEGDPCPQCGHASITLSRGIEVGNIFQLGTKYTKPMGMQYLDAEGNLQTPIMGCYGIGVGRLAASVCEARHDDFGPLWPMAIAPWQVHLCCLRSDDPAAKAKADQLYETLTRQGIEVIYDDRPVSAGVMFSDADLLGVPVRVIVSPRNLQNGVCEIVTRDKSISLKPPVEETAQEVRRLVKELSGTMY